MGSLPRLCFGNSLESIRASGRQGQVEASGKRKRHGVEPGQAPETPGERRKRSMDMQQEAECRKDREMERVEWELRSWAGGSGDYSNKLLSVKETWYEPRRVRARG